MADQNNTPDSTGHYQGDMVGILHALFKRKWLVVFGIIGTTLLALVLAMILPKTYRSEGFFQFSDPSKEKLNPLFDVASQMLESSKLVVYSQLKDMGMLSVLKELEFELPDPKDSFVISIQKFKKYSSAFGSYQAFLSFVKRNKLLDENEFKEILSRIRDSGQFSKLRNAIYALSRDDLKDVGQTLLREKNYVVGVELEFEASSTKSAQRSLAALGEFIRFSIFSEKIKEWAAKSFNESNITAARFSNYIITNQAALKQLQRKRERLQALYGKYPAFSKLENRQVVALGDDGDRYLSLVAQLVGVESRIIDLERLLATIEIERQKNLLFSKFFTELKKTLDKKPGSGARLSQTIETLKNEFFKKEDMNDPVTRSVLNSLNIDIDQLQTLYDKTLQFVSGPSRPTIPEWPRKSIFMIFGFFIGILIFISLALVLEFWEKHKSLIREG
jgi:hypothetical protein